MEPRYHGSHHFKSQYYQSQHHRNNSANSSHQIPVKRNYKLLIDPMLVKGASTKIYRFEGIVEGDPTYPIVVVRDPRKLKLWIKPEICDLPVPRFKIDGNYIGPPPSLEVSIFNINDNIDKTFLHNEIINKYQCGPIEELHIYSHELSRRHLGIARVVFEDSECAKLCVKKMNGQTLMGRLLKVILDPFGKECKASVESIVDKLEEDARREEEIKECRKRPFPPPQIKPPAPSLPPPLPTQNSPHNISMADSNEHINNYKARYKEDQERLQNDPASHYSNSYYNEKSPHFTPSMTPHNSAHLTPHNSGHLTPHNSSMTPQSHSSHMTPQSHSSHMTPQSHSSMTPQSHTSHMTPQSHMTPGGHTPGLPSGPYFDSVRHNNYNIPPRLHSQRRPIIMHPPRGLIRQRPRNFVPLGVQHVNSSYRNLTPYHDPNFTNMDPTIWNGPTVLSTPPSVPLLPTPTSSSSTPHISWQSKTTYDPWNSESPKQAGEAQKDTLKNSVSDISSDGENSCDEAGTPGKTEKDTTQSLDLETRIAMLLQSKDSSVVPPFLSMNENASDDETKEKETRKEGAKSDVELEESSSNISTPNSDDSNSSTNKKEEIGVNEEPLSTPPSPFVSEEEYLFWYSKNIELKKEAHRIEREENKERLKKLRKRRLKRPSLEELKNLVEDNSNSQMNGNDCMSLASSSNEETPTPASEPCPPTSQPDPPKPQINFPNFQQYSNQNMPLWQSVQNNSNFPPGYSQYNPYMQCGNMGSRVPSQDFYQQPPPVTQQSTSLYDPIVNIVLGKVIDELKKILKKDLTRRMIEGTAFKTFESWWEEKVQVKFKQENKLLISNETQSVKPLLKRQEPTNTISSLLFDPKEGFNVENMSSFGLGFRAAMPKMPSFRKVKIKPPTPPRLEEEDSQGLGSDNEIKPSTSRNLETGRKSRQSRDGESSDSDSDRDDVSAKVQTKRKLRWSSDSADDSRPIDGASTPSEAASSASSGSSSESSSESEEEISEEKEKEELSNELEEQGVTQINKDLENLDVNKGLSHGNKILQMIKEDIENVKKMTDDKHVLSSFIKLQQECEERARNLLLERNKTPELQSRPHTPIPSPHEDSWESPSKEIITKSPIKSKSPEKIPVNEFNKENSSPVSLKRLEKKTVNGSIKSQLDTVKLEADSRTVSPALLEHSYCRPYSPSQDFGRIESKKVRGSADHDYAILGTTIPDESLKPELPNLKRNKIKNGSVNKENFNNKIKKITSKVPAYDRKKGLNTQLLPSTPVVFKPRNQMEEYTTLYSFLIKGIDQEDVEYIKRSYESMLADDRQSFWLNDTHWVAHPPTFCPEPSPKKRKKHHDELPIHKTGCARSEGIYKVDLKQKQKHKFTFHESTHHTQEEPVQQSLAVLDSSKAKPTQMSVSREVRSFQRRLLAAYGNETVSDLLKFNQLKFRKKLMKFGKSRIHDWGLFSMEAIAADEMVIEYVGQSIRPVIADLREEAYEKMGIGSSYLFRIDMVNIIDATKCGNLARFINHSCNPNCYAKIVTVETLKKIVIYSKQPIACGEEITYDYKFPIEDEKIVCLCGGSYCKGTLN